MVEAILYPNRSSTRRDTPNPGAPAALSDRCREQLLTNVLFTTPVSQIRYLRHRGTFTTHTPDRPDAATAVSAWCRAIIGSILYRKRSCTRRDTPYPRARRQNIQTGVVKNVIYDTGVANTLFTTPRHVRGTDPGSARRRHSCVGMV